RAFVPASRPQLRTARDLGVRRHRPARRSPRRRAGLDRRRQHVRLRARQLGLGLGDEPLPLALFTLDVRQPVLLARLAQDPLELAHLRARDPPQPIEDTHHRTSSSSWNTRIVADRELFAYS